MACRRIHFTIPYFLSPDFYSRLRLVPQAPKPAELEWLGKRISLEFDSNHKKASAAQGQLRGFSVDVAAAASLAKTT